MNRVNGNKHILTLPYLCNVFFSFWPHILENFVRTVQKGKTHNKLSIIYWVVHSNHTSKRQSFWKVFFKDSRPIFWQNSHTHYTLSRPKCDQRQARNAGSSSLRPPQKERNDYVRAKMTSLDYQCRCACCQTTSLRRLKARDSLIKQYQKKCIYLLNRSLLKSWYKLSLFLSKKSTTEYL